MIIYIDKLDKNIYIAAPKCGSTSIASKIGVHVCNDEYSIENNINYIQDASYKKIIVYRKNIIGRFLSGFFEDLFNNSCYNTMEITFETYIYFLYKCYKDKIQNVINLECIGYPDIGVWFGNCSNVTLSITDENGNFRSHIQSQEYSTNMYIEQITDSNVILCELNKLDYFIKKHENIKVENYSIDISGLSLKYIKENCIIVKSIKNKKLENMILEMYESDIYFINKLKEKYQEIN
jgi:hypothetical protein